MSEVTKVENLTHVPKNATGIFEDKDGNKYWYLNGKRHRVDGPAAEYSDGFKVWLLNGIRMSEAEHEIKSRKYKTKVGRLLYG